MPVFALHLHEHDDAGGRSRRRPQSGGDTLAEIGFDIGAAADYHATMKWLCSMRIEDALRDGVDDRAVEHIAVAERLAVEVNLMNLTYNRKCRL